MRNKRRNRSNYVNKNVRLRPIETLEQRRLLTVVAVDDSGPEWATSEDVVFTSDAGGGAPLVAAGAMWSYYDDGPLSEGWQNSAFDDNDWPQGAAELGYGDGDVVTLIDSAVRPTYYFRHEFNVANTADIGALTLRLVRDDGAAVYINGQEVARDNLNPNAGYNDLATGTVAGADESRFFEFDVDPGVLVNGTNVVAAEVHQASANSSDISFNLELVPSGLAPILANDDFAAVNGSPTVTVASQPVDSQTQQPAGTVVMAADGTFTFTPALNYIGVAEFEYQVVDDDQAPTTATVSIVVAGINDAPLADPDSYQGAEGDASLTVDAANGLLANDVDLEGEALTVQLIDTSAFTPDVGTLAVNEDGSLTFTPAGTDVSGDWSFTYVAVDEGGAISTPTEVTISFAPVDDGPVTAVDDAYSVNEDIPLVVDASSGTGPLGAGILANDTTAPVDEGDPLTINVVQNVANGQLQLNADGSFTYTANFGFEGTDTFVYTVNDGFTDSNEATVTFTVTAFNDPPVAAPDVYTTGAGTPLTTFAGNSASTYIRANHVWNYLDDGTDQGGLGTFSPDDPTWFASPDYDDSGWQFGAAELGYGDNDETTVIDFGGNAQAKHPSYYFRTTFDAPNASMVDTLQFDLVADDGGAAYLNGIEIARLRLDPNASSTTFANAVDPSDGNTATRFVVDLVERGITLLETGNVLAVEVHQRSGTSSDISFATVLQTVATGGVLDNDVDEENDEFEVVGVLTEPNGGTIEVNPDGSFTYTPVLEMVGVDSFVYQIAEVDNPDNTATATVTINVTAAQLPPVANDDIYEIGVNGFLFAEIASPETALSIDARRLIDFGGEWHYLDDGSDQGTAWKEVDFDVEDPDGQPGTNDAWREGVASFGYGGAETTTIRFGPDEDNANNDTQDKFVTTYFRREFVTPDNLEINQLYTVLRVDDGAAVYINGVEVARHFMLDERNYDQLAFRDGGAGNTPYAYQIPVNILNEPGETNVIAVEVHQFTRFSSDLAFDLELLVPTGRFGVIANDTDLNVADTLRTTLIQGPTNAFDFALDPEGTFIYEPNLGFSGTDSFIYQLSDGNGGTDTATVQIGVGVTISTPPPQVVSIGMNTDQVDPPNRPMQGAQPTTWVEQRSDIASIVVEFDRPVLATINDFVLTNLGVDTADDDVQIMLEPDSLTVNSTTAVLSFEPNELPDGVYSLQILPSLTNLDGEELDGDGDGTGGDAFVHTGTADNKFHRLLGDMNGDIGTTIFDFPSFQYWFGSTVPSAPRYADMNNDGGVTIFDFSPFAAAFGNTLMFNAARPWLPPQAADLPVAELPQEANAVVEAIVQPLQHSLVGPERLRRDSAPTRVPIAASSGNEVIAESLLDILAEQLAQIPESEQS